MVSEEIRSRVSRHLIQHTDFLKVKDRMREDELRVFVDHAISEMCYEEHIDLATEERIALVREFVMATVSLGPLRPLMEDDTIAEVMVNAPDKVFIQRHGKILLSDVKFDSVQHVIHTVQKILAASGTNQRVDESSPYADFSLPDGARVNVIMPPCTLSGPILTIRKFSKEINSLDDLIRLKMLDQKMAAFLVACIQAKLNIVFCGSTGTGKTTTLNVLSRHISEEERIITIEDTPELRLKQEHVVTLQTKPANIEGRGEITIQDLFINSLRMRPDRIIIGEVRSHEMMDLIQSIASGHSGSLAVVHADSPEDCVDRMVTMIMMAGLKLSLPEIRKQIGRAIDLVVHIELFKDGVRRITNITDVYYDLEKKDALLRDIFRFVQDGKEEDGSKVIGHWDLDKRMPSFMTKFDRHDIRLPDGFFEKGKS
ncbi:MAG TPA: ATPase, T2SS/T4P/T4SS family [Candidatus Omnitrophota bacterium]|jgi:pilus assembly protein CpaF|nr:ATPase, T2SS/T4P/T4SS family [Candidatus Omnitrophota bacterium]